MTGQLDNAERLAHSCKGGSATIGADSVAQAAAALEQALRAKRPQEDLQTCLEILAARLEALLRQLREQLPGEVDGYRLLSILSSCLRSVASLRP
jgi:HPt (histidine-containing phosphotransfer) domain-containing protein